MIRKRKFSPMSLHLRSWLSCRFPSTFLPMRSTPPTLKVFNRENFIEREIEYDQEYFTDTHKLEIELDKVKLEIAKMSTDLERVSLEYAELTEELEVIKSNLDWLNKTTEFGAYTRKMLQELPQNVDLESLQDYRAQVNIRLYEISKAKRVLESDKLQELIALYKTLSTAIDSLIAVSSDYSLVLEDARAFFKERQVWTYSNSPIWENVFKLDSRKLFGVREVISSSVQSIDWSKARLSLVYFVGLSLLLLFLNWWSRLKLDLVSQRQEKVFGNPLKDSFSNSIVVLLITFVASSILPIFSLPVCGL